MLSFAPDWPAPPGVRAACSLRTGGSSRAPYASLNLGTHVGDEPAAVAENRQRLCRALCLPAEPLWLSQQHGTELWDADAQSLPDSPPRVDAALTRRAGCVLAVQVADCLPVLLARQDGSAIAVAHAGWRGLAAGVLERTVTALGGEARELRVWLGPAISAPHFEVGEEVRALFCAHDPAMHSAFAANERGRWQCDLRALAHARLSAIGVRSLYGDGRCTFAEREAFFSHRRDGSSGRFAALIWLEPTDRR